MRIRKYMPSDREAVEAIHFQTGYLGKSMSELLTDNRIWKRRIAHYLDKESKSVFVLEDKLVVGYLAGSLEDHFSMPSFFLETLWDIASGLPFHRKDRSFWLGQGAFLVRAALGISPERHFSTPKNSGHLHINLLPEARGKGWGTKLLAEFEGYAAKNGMSMIHADSFQTRLNPTANFWLGNGFTEYSRVRTSGWQKQLPNEPIDLVCYVKKL